MQRFDIVLDGRCQSVSVLSSLVVGQSPSWHAHDYRQRPADRAPTPHLIRNILGLQDAMSSDVVRPCLERSSTYAARSCTTSLVSSSSVGPDDDRHFGSGGHVVDAPVNGLEWSTSGPRRAGHVGNSSTTSSAAADTTLKGQYIMRDVL